MKIAFITSHIYKSTQWNWFSEELLQRGIFHIHIIISDEYPLMADELKKQGVKVFVLPHHSKLSLLTNLFKIIKILKQEKINLVHTELPYGNLLGQTAALLSGIKRRITTCENASWAIDNKNKKQFLIDKLTYRLAKKIIVLTDLSKQYLIKNYKVPEHKLITIWHAVKAEEYQEVSSQRVEKLKNELRVKEDKFILGMVARGEEWKGHIYAIKAIALLKNKYPNLLLIIAGIDETKKYGKQITDYLNTHHVTDNVRLIRFVTDNVALYRLFQIHIHIPIDEMAETFGITYIEGMISGCAQILTKSGIAFTTAQHLKNCYVVDYCNSEEIAKGIVSLIEDKKLKSEISRQAKEDARKLFDYSIKVNKHLELYNSID
ncbi:MAG: glycosyltransferase family 4 protein [Bacteroidetes bacterium]|nr:glycosyltransferase family 4 protein [Bacteroidota bacterium]